MANKIRLYSGVFYSRGGEEEIILPAQSMEDFKQRYSDNSFYSNPQYIQHLGMFQPEIFSYQDGSIVFSFLLKDGHKIRFGDHEHAFYNPAMSYLYTQFAQAINSLKDRINR